MKNKIRFSILFYLAFLGVSVVSCVCGSHPDKFKVASFIWKTAQVNFDTNTGQIINFTAIETNSVKYNQFVIDFFPEIEEYYSLNTSSFSFSLLNTAYACSFPESTTTDKITNIKITSSVDFNSNYLAGSNLASLFNIRYLDNYSFTQDNLSTYNSSKHLVSYDDNISLILNASPDFTENRSFTVTISLDATINEFVFTTNSIEIRI